MRVVAVGTDAILAREMERQADGRRIEIDDVFDEAKQKTVLLDFMD